MYTYMCIYIIYIYIIYIYLFKFIVSLDLIKSLERFSEILLIFSYIWRIN